MDFPNFPIIPGVLYHTGLTDADYDEAIQALQDAKMQPAHMLQCCTICHDTGHLAYQCHHNPLVMARRAIMATQAWRCFHCNEVFTDYATAQEHFGRTEAETAKCLRASDISAKGDYHEQRHPLRSSADDRLGSCGYCHHQLMDAVIAVKQREPACENCDHYTNYGVPTNPKRCRWYLGYCRGFDKWASSGNEVKDETKPK